MLTNNIGNNRGRGDFPLLRGDQLYLRTLTDAFRAQFRVVTS